MTTDNKLAKGIQIMRAIERVVMIAIGSICLLGSAAASQLTGAEIQELISGNSVYLQLTKSVTGTQGPGIIYYDELGMALFKTPKGVIWHGKWKIEGNKACINWNETTHNPCAKYDKRGDTLTTINVDTGATRGKITKIVTGNAEKLTPNY